MNNHRTSQIRSAVTIFLAVVGLILMTLAVLADELGLDITPGFGVVQMVAFLSGLTMMTLAAFLFVGSKRPAEAPHSLQADIGARLVATGLVFAYVAGLSDVIGIGTHVEPSFARPFVGPLQLGGIIIGLVAIVAGLAMAYTSRGQRESSSLEFLVHPRREAAPEESKQPRPEK